MSALSRFAEENGGLTLNEAVAAWDAVEKERERCARIASEFTLRSDRRIHPDVSWDDMSEDARYIAHTTAQQIAERIRSDQ
jgi:hypothetical protein